MLPGIDALAMCMIMPVMCYAAANCACHMHQAARAAHRPPVQPVLTSQALVPCCAIFSASMLAYFMGCHMRKAPPKQALKVASGSVTPSSVPATWRTHSHVNRVTCWHWGRSRTAVVPEVSLGRACLAREPLALHAHQDARHMACSSLQRCGFERYTRL